jgi:hypothetical protein
MKNLESLRSLQKRIREAKGADCILDTDILVALLGEYEGELWDRQGNPLTLDPDGLGPCVALMREVLPGCRWTKTASGRYRVWGNEPDYILEGSHPAIWSDSEPLANDCLTFLDAIFSAVIAKEEAKHTEKAG